VRRRLSGPTADHGSHPPRRVRAGQSALSLCSAATRRGGRKGLAIGVKFAARSRHRRGVGSGRPTAVGAVARWSIAKAAARLPSSSAAMAVPEPATAGGRVLLRLAPAPGRRHHRHVPFTMRCGRSPLSEDGVDRLASRPAPWPRRRAGGQLQRGR
jgi:hypothetical protein